MTQSLKLVIAAVVGGFVALSFVALCVVAAYLVDSPHDLQSQISRQDELIDQYRLDQQGNTLAQSKQLNWIFTRLDTLEQSQALVNDHSLTNSIEAEVEKAIAKAGVDKESLTDRVRAIIREIAKQSAQEQGRAENHARQPSANRQDAAGVGQPVSGVSPVSAESDHILGDADAPVSLIVYDDFECPFCRRHHPTLKKIAERFEGRVNVVFRQMPLGMHNPAAKQEALISECVARQGGNEAFWSYADGVFKRTGGNGRGLTDTAMDSLLSGLGLSPQSVHDCVDDNREQLLAAINHDMTEAQRLGVRGTPGNVLIHNASGEALRINGARPMAQFVPAINVFLEAE